MNTIYMLFAVCIVGCSSSVDSVSSANTIPPTNGSNDPLQAVAFGGNVLETQTRFISYTKKAGRVSLIDPQNEIEVWGKNASGFDFAVALPDLNGATLFSQNQLLILSSDSQKSIPLNKNYAHIAVAKKQAAYSLASEDGQSFEVIRFLGNQQWQHEVFDVPWAALDPTITVAPDKQPVLLATQFNDDGSLLFLFRPADGRYGLFSATSASTPLSNANSSGCQGNGVGLPTDATFTSLTWDEGAKIFYIGDKNGRIYALDPLAVCADYGLLPNIKLPSDSPIYRISVYDNGNLGVVQDQLSQNGQLYKLSFNGSDFTAEQMVANDICAVPLGSVNLGSDYIVVVCTTDSVFISNSDATPDTKDITIDPRVYITLDNISGEIINVKNINNEFSAAVAIDANNQTLYRMLEGGFGTLEVTNLVTGQTHRNVGLFIAGILN